MDSIASQNLLAGAIFGFGLTLSGVASPQVITDQFELTDFHMLVTFLTASASSAAVFAAYNRARPTNEAIPVRSSSGGSWIGKYDANVIGGAMLGVGMAMTGACPGTGLVQVAAGADRSLLVVGASLLGGVVWVKCAPLLMPPPPPPQRAAQPGDEQETDSIMAATGWSVTRAFVSYELAMLVGIGITLAFGHRNRAFLHPILGGLVIGFGQLSSVLLTRKPVGVSTSHEECGKLFWSSLAGQTPRKFAPSMLFTIGLTVGSWLTMLVVPSVREVVALNSQPSSPFPIILGGFLLSFGARVAGGCTSGHGISGMATLSLGSLTTVMSMFGAGLFYRLSMRFL